MYLQIRGYNTILMLGLKHVKKIIIINDFFVSVLLILLKSLILNRANKCFLINKLTSNTDTLTF